MGDNELGVTTGRRRFMQVIKPASAGAGVSQGEPKSSGRRDAVLENGD